MAMNPLIARLKTAEECESFAKNVEKTHPELAQQARRRAVELRAASYGATTDAEREALQAVFAVEEVLTQKNGKKTKASRTWQSINKYGIIGTVQRVVNRSKQTDGYTALRDMGMADFTFEAVVLRHPTLFSADALSRAQTRLSAQNADGLGNGRE
jgi:hypothetical protein